MYQKIKDIFQGWYILTLKFFGLGDEKIEKLADYRRLKVINNCKCTKYLVSFKLFGKQFNWFGYCQFCGCNIEAKIRCKECHCVQGRW